MKNFTKGHIPWNKGLKGFLAGEKHYNYGKKWSEEIKLKMSQNRKGLLTSETHFAWKADKVGYRALHQWVESRLGKPQHCSLCNDTSKHRYHWANVSGKYLRNTFDWIRLCPKCHKSFDKKRLSPSEIFKKNKTQYSERRVV